MDGAIVRQFVDFFQDFLHLCQSENWPNNDTSEAEVKNAFLISKHIEKCLEKLHRRNILNEFISSIKNHNDTSNALLKSCFADPPKYILKKIINSKTKISQMDTAISCFTEVFSDEKLESCLADIMVEAASKQTLLKNLSQQIPKEKVLEFKSQLFLSELSQSDNPKDAFTQIFNNSSQDTVDLIVVSTLNNDYQYYKSVNCLVHLLMETLKNKYHGHKQFWKHLFKVDTQYLVDMSLKHSRIFKLIVQALFDSGKLLREQMSADYFYIDLTYSELVSNVQKLCENDNLTLEFLDIVRETESDLSFWDNIVSKS